MQIEFRDLGRIAYEPALEIQRQVHDAVLRGEQPPTVLLVEHEPVITLPKREAAVDHLIADADRLAEVGVEVCRTDRGGDITYHGPGQLVAYPIVPLEPLGLNLRRYIRLLEQVVIDAVATFGIAAHRDACAVGVWVESAKLAAIGVRIRRWVTMHGLALNVTTELSHFDLIVPCGLHGRAVTSLQRLLGARCPTLDEVKSVLCQTFTRSLGGMGGADRAD